MSYKQRLRRRRACKAFSLVEIMVVIVIIGLLASVVTVNVRSYMTRAKQNAARQEIATIVQALEAFYTATGRYPTNEEGIVSLTKPSQKFPEPPLSGEPRDPWGNSYQYNCPGTSGAYDVICYGGDGREGGSGADADITNHNLKE